MKPIVQAVSLSAILLSLATVAVTPLASGGVAAQAPHVVEFEVVASTFKFEPSRLEVAQGDRVRILLHSVDRDHGFAIKKLRIEKLIPASGEVLKIEFDAKEAGEFEIMCTEVCGLGHDDMKGSLVVAARATAALSGVQKPQP